MKNFCQSCGMPLSKDPKNGGTEKDGSKSTEYCSYCYVNGEFFEPDCEGDIGKIDTPQKMQKLCIKKMTEQGMPKFLAWILTRTIPKLKRWK